MSLARAVSLLQDAFPDQPFGDRSAVVYAEQLADLEPDAVYAAVSRLVNTSRYLPRISEIRREVVEAALALPSAEEAWELVLSVSVDKATTPLPGPVQRALKAVGGRWMVAHSENPDTIRAQFRKTYENLRESCVREHAAGTPITPEQLRPGRRPFEIPPAVPVAVGDTPISLAGKKVEKLPVSTSIRPKR